MRDTAFCDCGSAQGRAGSRGLPGAIAPEPPLTILAQMRKQLPLLIRQYVDNAGQVLVTA